MPIIIKLKIFSKKMPQIKAKLYDGYTCIVAYTCIHQTLKVYTYVTQNNST